MMEQSAVDREAAREEGIELLRGAEKALARASAALKDVHLKEQWYECNRYYHGVHKLIERLQ